jgi:hypothetical protein
MYMFKVEVREEHGNYKCHSLLMWTDHKTEEWVAGDMFVLPAQLLEGMTEHEDIIAVIQTALSRIAQKYDRTLF